MSNVLAYIVKGSAADAIAMPKNILQDGTPEAISFTNVKLAKDGYAAENKKGSEEPFVRQRAKKGTLFISARENLGDGRFRVHNLAIDATEELRGCREMRRNLHCWVAGHIHAPIDMDFAWEESKGRFQPVAGNKKTLEDAIAYCWAFSGVLELIYQRAGLQVDDDDASYVEVSSDVYSDWESDEDTDEDDDEDTNEDSDEDDEDEQQADDDEHKEAAPPASAPPAGAPPAGAPPASTPPASTPAATAAPKAATIKFDNSPCPLQEPQVTPRQILAWVHTNQWWKTKGAVSVFQQLQKHCLARVSRSHAFPYRPEYAAEVVHSFANGCTILNTGMLAWPRSPAKLDNVVSSSTEITEGKVTCFWDRWDRDVFPGQMVTLYWPVTKDAAATSVQCQLVIGALKMDLSFRWGTVACIPREPAEILEDAASLYETACRGLQHELGEAVDFAWHIKDQLRIMEEERCAAVRADLNRIQADLRYYKLLMAIKEDAEGRAAAEEERRRQEDEGYSGYLFDTDEWVRTGGRN